jgi:hypothetical protein
MALTRKFLTALGIDDEKIDEIITAHSETVNALKEQRDTYKEKAEKLPTVEKELNDLKEAHKDDDGKNPFEVKYNALKEEFNDYKKEITAKETKAAKTGAYKALLKEVGISEKRIDSVLKVTNLDEVELDENGKIKDSDKLKDGIKTEWADFIVQTSTQGANTETPPDNNGGNTMTKEQIRAIKDPQARQKAMLENKGLFGLK